MRYSRHNEDRKNYCGNGIVDVLKEKLNNLLEGNFNNQSMNNNDPEIKKLFLGYSTAYDGYYYKGNGGYVFSKTFWLGLNSLFAYEDINIGGKARIPTNTCLPLVVTSPNTFTVPQTRAIGTVNYSPTYIPYR